MFYELSHPIVPDYFFTGQDTDFNFPAHIHYCYEIICVTSGIMNVVVNDTEYSLSAGEAVFIPSNQIHSMHTTYRSSHKLFIFAPNLVSVYTKALGDRVPVCHKFTLSRLCMEMAKNTDVSSSLLEKKSLLYFLCSEFDKNAEYVTPQKNPAPLIYRIFEFIQTSYSGSCTLHDVSAHTGYDYSYLSSYFKRIAGMSFNDYVNQVRVSHASYLLSNTDLGILSVSTECGFKSLRSFNRNFKEHMDITPTEYRIRLQKKLLQNNNA